MDEHGKVNGSVRLAMAGQEALYWRQVPQKNEGDEVSNRFNE
jgi:hypothetical protein